MKLLTITITEEDAMAVMAMAWSWQNETVHPLPDHRPSKEAKEILRRVNQEIDSARNA